MSHRTPPARAAAAAYKHRGGFYLLVTDEGYRDQSSLVWESLSNVRPLRWLCTQPPLSSHRVMLTHLLGVSAMAVPRWAVTRHT
jgi:hypothetical protein